MSSHLDLLRNTDLSSELDVEGEILDSKRKRYDLATKESKFGAHKVFEHGKKIHRSDLDKKIDQEEAINRRGLLTIDAYSRHVKMVNDYINYYGGSTKELLYDHSKDRNIADVLREEHKFIWDSFEETDLSWSKRLAKKYYDRLFREYCIIDLSFYTTGNIGMRWRTHKEVLKGKGQFICGEKHCINAENLASWEVNFAYAEKGKDGNLEKKTALVKARLCPKCSVKLNFKYLPQIKALRKHQKHEKRRHKVNHNPEITEQKSTSKHSPSQISKSASDSNTDTETDVIEQQSKNLRNESQTPIASSTQKSENAETENKSEIDLQKIWSIAGVSSSQTTKENIEKSREEEFDEYFQDLFL